MSEATKPSAVNGPETIAHTVAGKTITEVFDPAGYYATCDGQRFETLGFARRFARGLLPDPTPEVKPAPETTRETEVEANGNGNDGNADAGSD